MAATAASFVKNFFKPDTIGPAECPILHRWTLFPPGFGSNSSSVSRHLTAPDWLPKLLLHHFMPQADERHFHDHPRGFYTLVLRGGYDDLVPCPTCQGTGTRGGVDTSRQISFTRICKRCLGASFVLGERMRPGMWRYRPATHRHRTTVHGEGAWTLVLMGPKRREWGFWIGAQFMEWKQYFKEYGFGMRCV